MNDIKAIIAGMFGATLFVIVLGTSTTTSLDLKPLVVQLQKSERAISYVQDELIQSQNLIAYGGKLSVASIPLDTTLFDADSIISYYTPWYALGNHLISATDAQIALKAVIGADTVSGRDTIRISADIQYASGGNGYYLPLATKTSIMTLNSAKGSKFGLCQDATVRYPFTIAAGDTLSTGDKHAANFLRLLVKWAGSDSSDGLTPSILHLAQGIELTYTILLRDSANIAGK